MSSVTQRVVRLVALTATGTELLAMTMCTAAWGYGMGIHTAAWGYGMGIHAVPSARRPPAIAATGVTVTHGPTGDTASMGRAMGRAVGTMPMTRPSVAAARSIMPAVSVASLTGPRAAAHVHTFTLVARPARLRLGPGVVVDAWTYDGTAPGPTLRVRQGDLVVVRLVNRLPVATTIHWHGVAVPGGEDGVAGLTQDAVPPGGAYTYRFITRDAGTYWYHAHQDSLTQVACGLYGALVVTPATPARSQGMRDDVDATIALHSWQVGGRESLVANGTTGILCIGARPGAWVRLRLINTDVDTHTVIPVGAPFTVAALDGHDLNGPQPLTSVLLPIAAGGRYDVRFRMPSHGTVGVRLADDKPGAARPLVVVGAGALPPLRRARGHAQFDLTRYGAPRPGAIIPRSRVDVSYTLRLGDQTPHGRGFAAVAHPNPVYTINGVAAPDTAPIVVRRGQFVRLHIVNESDYVHPMHLHGHSFVVLARDGRPLRGSPVTLDTLNVRPGESYDIAFRANNPGIWMLHCHNLYHARYGMSMMVMYEGVTTPFKPGGSAGNISD